MNSLLPRAAVQRWTALAAVITLLVSACVAPVTVESTEDATQSAGSAAEASTAEASTDDDAAAEETSAGDAACAEGFRLFDHELLVTDPICIPENPQTIVPLDIASLEMTLLAGKTPLATGAWMLDEMPLLIPAFAGPLASVEGLGWPAELERVAALAPDLILSPADAIDVELASQIAPVVVPDAAIYSNWKLGMEFWAAALNMEDRYAEMEANYNARIAELHAALGDGINQEISIVSIAGGPMLWMPDSAPGAVIADAGLQRPEAQRFVGDEAIAEYGDSQWIQISSELIGLVDGDHIYYFTYASVDPEAAAEADKEITDFAQAPIWQSLEAVKAGNAHRVGPHWWRAQTYYLASLVIDDLFATLTETTATTPVLAIEE